MTEFEVHQLIASSRTEFDLGTVFLVIINLIFIAFALNFNNLSPSKARWLCVTCGTISLFIILRIIAAIIRFVSQSKLLESMSPDYNHTFLMLQYPTLISRLLVILGLPLISIWFLRKSIA